MEEKVAQSFPITSSVLREGSYIGIGITIMFIIIHMIGMMISVNFIMSHPGMFICAFASAFAAYLAAEKYGLNDKYVRNRAQWPF